MVESSLSVQWAVRVHKNDLWGGKALVDWQLTKKNLNGGKKRKRWGGVGWGGRPLLSY